MTINMCVTVTLWHLLSHLFTILERITVTKSIKAYVFEKKGSSLMKTNILFYKNRHQKFLFYGKM